jgi:tetratricopeptide (TPR) repeat protein
MLGTTKDILSRAISLEKTGMFKQAVDLYFKILERNPVDKNERDIFFDALNNSFEIIFSSERPPFHLDKITGYLIKGSSLFPKDLRLENNLGFAFFHLAQKEIAKGSEPAARIQFDRARLIFQSLLGREEVKSDVGFYARVLTNMGYTLAAPGLTGKALEYLNQAIALDPESVGAKTKKAEILGSPAHSRLNDAFTIIDEGLKKDPDDIKFLSAKARIFLCNGKYKDAVALFKKCAGLEPNNTKHLSDVGNAQTHRGNNFRAAVIFFRVAWRSEDREEKEIHYGKMAACVIEWLKYPIRSQGLKTL